VDCESIPARFGESRVGFLLLGIRRKPRSSAINSFSYKQKIAICFYARFYAL
jgi:hypothetical protein